MRDCYFKKFQLVPTDFNLYVYVGNFKKAEQSMLDLFGLPTQWNSFQLQEGVAHTYCFWSNKIKERIFIICTPDFDPANIAHEAVHVTWELARVVDFVYDVEHQEQQAYYVDWILNCALSMKGKKQLIVNNTVIQK